MITRVPEASDEQRTSSRAHRRASGGGTADPLSAAPVGRHSSLLLLLAVVLGAALLTASVYADPRVAALAVGLGGLVLAWGWPGLLALPSPRGTSTVLALTAAGVATATALTTADPLLEWVPAALAGGVLAAYVHQLLRRDGRPRLVSSVAGTLTGVAVLAGASGFVALARVPAGAHATLATLAGVAIATVADHLSRTATLRSWSLPLGMALAGGLAVGLGQLTGVPLGVAGLLGVVGAGVSHALRGVLAPLPSMAGARSQLTSGLASVLITGVLAYLICRSLVG